MKIKVPSALRTNFFSASPERQICRRTEQQQSLHFRMKDYNCRFLSGKDSIRSIVLSI